MLKAVESKATEKARLGNLIDPMFQQAFQLLMSKELPVRVSLELLKYKENLTKHKERYETLRTNLLEKYGERDAEGKLLLNEQKTQYVLKDAAGFNKEYQELLDLEVEMSKIPFSYIESLKLSPAFLQSLVNTAVNVDL